MRKNLLFSLILACSYSCSAVSSDCYRTSAEESIICLEDLVRDLKDEIKHPIVKYRVLEGFEKPQITQSKKIPPFSVGLSACIRNHLNLICQLRVSNSGTENRLTIYSDSIFYDDLGNEYSLNHASIANKVEKFPVFGGLEKTVLTNIPTDIEIVFHHVPLHAGRVVRLDLAIGIGTYQKKRYRLEFNNIAILTHE